MPNVKRTIQEDELTEQIEIDFSLDPAERVKLEMDATKDPNQIAIGKYLLEQFSVNELLKNCYKDRKITLNAIVKFVNESARKYLNSKNGMIEDTVVFGWVVHYIHDEPVKITESKSYVLTTEDKESARERAIKQFEAEELAKLKKAEERKAEAQKKKFEKEIQKEKDSGQMNLFGDF